MCNNEARGKIGLSPVNHILWILSVVLRKILLLFAKTSINLAIRTIWKLHVRTIQCCNNTNLSHPDTVEA